MSLDFESAYDEHVWAVYGYIAYRVRRRADAEDLTQVTFEKALRSWHRFDPRKASVRTWLLAIARNTLIDHVRLGKVRDSDSLPPEDLPEELAGSTEGPHEAVGLDPDLDQALGALSEHEREVIALRFGGDMSGREIADELEISLANAQQILSRGLRKLRDRLDPA